MFVRWQLLLSLIAWTSAFDSLDGGFCPDGECINCQYCDGDCFSACTCETELNTCCCIAPRGHYARGYEKIPCPGGTYQDQTGQNSCKPCSQDATVLFDVNYRGAIDLVDCDEAKSRCSSSSCSNSTACQVQCVSSVAVESAMVAKPADTAFCAGLDQQIPTRGCSWRTESSWAPAATAEALLAVLILLIAREI
mmetsp:Transcript_35452/g.57005  ORF Transcript_35452/g.57005 Transcript_35452/m.57005 type:complete len:194 (-) Transcript_35452:79-660(-)